MTAADESIGAEQALRDREITFAALAQVAPVGIMRFDPAGRCNYVNDRWAEISGRTIDQAIGDGWTNSIHPADRDRIVQHWERLREAEEVFRQEYRLLHPNGETRWVLAEGTPLRGYSREVLGFIRAVTDITVHRQLEADLTAARAGLEERVEERTADLQTEMAERERLEKQVLQIKENEQRRFSQDLHDGLGQSLTGALFQALALERDLHAAESPFASTASKMAELVNRSIAQAHDLARGVDPVPLRPDGLMNALDDLAHALCEAHPLQCGFECEEPVLLDDNAVASHLYRIAQEALTNAIKHSGGTRVQVRLERVPGGISVAVEDDGSGLPAAAAHKRGRGLNIIRHRARLIGATLTFEKVSPQGTRVRCDLAQPASAASGS
ncbi:MAG: PAS domain S-box protein [Verrucomicrobiota bacterium]|nr:PAS domain S-box protein [Verrucomicrobiota bacterium]